MNAQHLATTPEWFTPSIIVEAARAVLGGTIDFDPASCAEANETVQAVNYYSQADDGLTAEWHGGSIFINPPGGTRLPPAPGKKRGTGGMLPALFWQRLMHHRACRLDFTHAIFVAYSLEQLATTQKMFCPPMLWFPVCFPSDRIHFVAPAGKKAGSPTHSNAIVYVPGSVDRSATFRVTFNQFGVVK